MLTYNPTYISLAKTLNNVMQREDAINDGDHPDSPSNKAYDAMINHRTHDYTDEGGKHLAAAKALLRQANEGEIIPVDMAGKKPKVKFAQMNPDHALPAAYLMAVKFYEQEQNADALPDKTTAPVVASHGNQTPLSQQLESLINASKIRNAAPGADVPDLEFMLRPKIDALIENIEKEYNAPSIYGDHGDHMREHETPFMLEALGQMCVEELKERGTPQQPQIPSFQDRVKRVSKPRGK